MNRWVVFKIENWKIIIYEKRIIKGVDNKSNYIIC